ncbi:MAG: AhpC/TSA family protein [Flavobacteriales bacterium]|nr:AhpC/TSA family protein [Flavobacteriales bacterium]
MPRLITFLRFLPLLPFTAVQAQSVSGVISGVPAGSVAFLRLYATRGMDHLVIDSVRVDDQGRFSFADRSYPTGYYRVGFEGDQVDLILGDGVEQVRLEFDGRPLQSHITVHGSEVNQRLWEYKYASRESQRQLQEIAGRRAQADPHDAALLNQLTDQEEQVQARLSAVLDRIIGQDQSSFFAKTVRVDRAVMDALEHGTEAVRDAMDWSDATLTRSAVYPRAVMALLQSATPASPEMLQSASDSLLAWASGDLDCWSFVRITLAQLFATYGPPDVLQHLVDRYIVGPHAWVAPEPELLVLVAEQMKVAIGAVGPDLDLPRPNSPKVYRLSELMEGKELTVLFFYSSTCDHCHHEMPGLNALFDRYKERRLAMVGIALDDDAAEFEANIAERGLQFPCFSELLAWGSPAAKAYAVKATPTLILLDADGRIVAKPYDHVELERLLAQRLGQ